MADPAITQWANNIGLPVCVGELFVAENGRLPATLPELVNWGNTTGRRNPTTQVWNCGPRTGGATLPGGTVTRPGTGGIGGDLGGIVQQVTGLIQQYPIPAAVVGFLLLRRRR